MSKNRNATELPPWFDASTTHVAEVEDGTLNRLVITGSTRSRPSFELIMKRERGGTNVWLMECRNPGLPISHASFSPEEFRAAFGGTRAVETFDHKLAEHFDAEFVIPGKFARTDNHLVMPGPRSLNDYKWPLNTAHAPILIDHRLKELVIHLLWLNREL